MNRKQNRVQNINKNKMRSQGGFTLVEMVAAVLVLMLLILLLNTGLNLALKSYRTMTAEAETQVLMSSVSNVLEDELRYARDIEMRPGGAGGAGGTGGTGEPGGTGGSGESGGTGEAGDAGTGGRAATGAQIETNVERFISVSFGRNTVLSLENGILYANGRLMLASGAYGNGDYRIEKLKIMYDEDKEIFNVEIIVGGIDDIKAENTFVVKPLNAIKSLNPI